MSAETTRGRVVSRRPSRSTALISVASVVGAVLLWQFVTMFFVNPVFFPTPVRAFEKGVEMIGDGSLFGHVQASLARIFAGFFVGSLIGAPVGLLMGNFRPVRALFEPYIQFFRFVPSIAWLTPAVIWFGIGEVSKVVIIVYTTVFIVIINTIVGVSNVAPNKIWAARSLGANRTQTFLFIVMPATLPFILTGMRLAMGNSFATVVSAELIAADEGIGYLISNARIFLSTETIFLAIVVLGTLGFISDRIFRLAITRFAHQYGPVD